MHKKRVSVRTMVETVVRTGDLMVSQSGVETLALAARAHRDIQESEGMESEVFCKLFHQTPVCEYEITGRIDGLYEKDGQLVLCEIKTVARDLESLTEQSHPAYWAQALCYGHMLCLRDGLASIIIELRYRARETGQDRSFFRTLTAGELEKEFFAIVQAYTALWDDEFARRDRRDAALAGANFPYDGYRPTQRTMARLAYSAAVGKSRVFIQAPTGTGKTAAVLFAALKALPQGSGERIFYLTARTTGARTALSFLERCAKDGLRGLQICAKSRICPFGSECDMNECPYAKGFFDKLPAALCDLFACASVLSGDMVLQVAQAHELCPFEFSLEAALWCDVIVCDYNYAFDPRANLRRFFTIGGDYTLLIDEAHELPDRARGMYSARLAHKDLTALRAALGKALTRKHAAYKATAALCKQMEMAIAEKDLPALTDALAAWTGEMGEHAAHCGQLFFDALFFLRIAKELDARYAIAWEGKSCELICLDAADKLRAVFLKCAGSVLFSATLSPIDYYKTLCVGDDGDTHELLPSFFPRENLLAAVVPLDVTYKGREAAVGDVCAALHAMVAAKAGNYLAFFPSYAYLKQVHEAFSAAYPAVDAPVLPQNSTPQARDELISLLDRERETPRLVFSVLGGVLSQSVDLPGDAPLGAAVVSGGLPQKSAQVDALCAYHTQQGRDGFAYASRYPAMGKVVQAAGRVLRTPTDRGVVLLIDKRFAQRDYQSLLPAHYGALPVLAPQKLPAALHAFWTTQKAES